MERRTLTIRIPHRWVAVTLVVLLAGLLVPAIAIAAGGPFVDDDSSIFEADIEWLAVAGITKGCNPPANDRFCAGQPVTRGQMAAFMRRFAQFLGAENGPVWPSATWWSNDNLPNDDFSASRAVTVPPGGGTLLIVGSFDFLNTGPTTKSMNCTLAVDGAWLAESTRVVYADPNQWGVCSITGARAVGPGSHTVTMESHNAWHPDLDPGGGTFHVIVVPRA
jgi:hypothetical protein